MFKNIAKFIFTRPLQCILSRPFIRYHIIKALYDNSVSPREKVMNLVMRYAAASKLTGDYFEFGVYEGNSMNAAFHISKQYLPNLRFYAFDSFEGLPETKKNGGFQPFEKGMFRCSEENFIKNLAKKGVDLSRIHTIKGWYQNTLNDATKASLPARSAAIVYIDCDLYESAALVLEFITSYLEHGSIILFDDWFTYRGDPAKGEQRAFKEWLSRHPEFSATEYHKFAWSGNSFIIHRR